MPSNFTNCHCRYGLMNAEQMEVVYSNSVMLSEGCREVKYRYIILLKIEFIL